MLSSKVSVLCNVRLQILDVILRAIEAISVIDGHSKEISSNKKLFQLVCELAKLTDKAEVHFCASLNRCYCIILNRNTGKKKVKKIKKERLRL